MPRTRMGPSLPGNPFCIDNACNAAVFLVFGARRDAYVRGRPLVKCQQRTWRWQFNVDLHCCGAHPFHLVHGQFTKILVVGRQRRGPLYWCPFLYPPCAPYTRWGFDYSSLPGAFKQRRCRVKRNHTNLFCIFKGPHHRIGVVGQIPVDKGCKIA